MKKDFSINIIGWLFLIWGILAVYNSLRLNNPTQILWGCYISLLLLGVGILRRDGLLIGSQLAIQFIPLLIWDIDFLYFLFSGNSLWGVTDYMFLERRLALSQIISLQHLFTIPLSLWALKLVKTKRVDFWKIGFIQVTGIFLLVILLTDKEANVNCVFNECLHLGIGLPYQVTWFLIYFLMIIIGNFILGKLKFIRK